LEHECGYPSKKLKDTQKHLRNMKSIAGDPEVIKVTRSDLPDAEQ
jgi:hypothetical protein